ncbi:MAG: DUF4209 domain-containing protein [Bryobacteraceae bacterium]|nr:DUF4209 domain-containing protein [Bryobacteraceae bacterium]
MNSDEVHRMIFSAGNGDDFQRALHVLASPSPFMPFSLLLLNLHYLHEMWAYRLSQQAKAEEMAVQRYLVNAFNCNRNGTVTGRNHLLPDAPVSFQGKELAAPDSGWRSFPVQAFETYWRAVQSTNYSNPAKAHLCDVLWESKAIWTKYGSTNLPKPIEVARLGIAFHVDSALSILGFGLETKSEALEFCFYWERATIFACQVRFYDKILAAQMKVQEVFERWRKLNNAWCAVLLRIEVLLRERSGDSSLVSDSRLQSIVETSAALRIQEFIVSMPWISKDLLDMEATVYRLLNQPISENDKLVREAQLFEQMAARATSSTLHAIYLQQASAKYQQSGEREKVAVLVRQIRALQLKALEDGEVNTTMTEVSIPREVIERELDRLLFGVKYIQQALTVLQRHFFVSSLDNPKISAKSGRSVLCELFTVVPIAGEDRPQKPLGQNASETEAFFANQELVSEIHLSSGFCLSPFFDRLCKDFAFDCDNAIAFLAGSAFWEPSEERLVRNGFEAFFSGAYDIAMHLLIPRLERFFRKICVAKGIDATALHMESLKERTFGSLIYAAKDGGLLSEIQALYFRVLLTEDWGLNLRNAIAHGLIDDSGLTKLNAERIIHVWFILSGLA